MFSGSHLAVYILLQRSLSSTILSEVLRVTLAWIKVHAQAWTRLTGEGMEDADWLSLLGSNLVLEEDHFLCSTWFVCTRGKYTNENLCIVREEWVLSRQLY